VNPVNDYKERNQIRLSTTSPIWGGGGLDATPSPILMACDTLADFHDIINFVNFGYDWIMIFVQRRVKYGHFLYLANTALQEHSVVRLYR
jgi:hypothetical protein